MVGMLLVGARRLEHLQYVCDDPMLQLVGFLTSERKNSDDAIQGILLANHPAFQQLATLTKTRYRVFFSTRAEMEVWLSARGWDKISSELFDTDSVEEWEKDEKYLKFTRGIFDKNDRLLPFTADDWDDGWIQLGVLPP